ncbi:hypothetical protein BDQ12DRAFT_687387 [Crucibulum laeve]|uniref:Uncharacterized protein n=1 Tax=Crucibulum laeve TaxID=68775 RepID=A0A5C3LSK8_9AGAR|nr:hypothetical protein BDQ12DRAFT_687387 [Crucibulum laeve]
MTKRDCTSSGYDLTGSPLYTPVPHQLNQLPGHQNLPFLPQSFIPLTSQIQYWLHAHMFKAQPSLPDVESFLGCTPHQMRLHCVRQRTLFKVRTSIHIVSLFPP